jgi:pSer/pThr/pTyr-binding forkhead associated (FHA) protein
MKVNLVVTAAGPNNGKAIPIAGAKFLIGRDPHCNLRPASQAVSKQHCAILVRDGQVYVQDMSSTNGTVVNDVPVQGEQELKDGDQLKVGPLDFTVQILPLPTPADGTPFPNKLKPLDSKATEKLRAATGPAATGGKSTPAQKPVAPAPQKEKIATASEGDDAAAMLLSMEDDAPSGEQPEIPGGSTVMEIPTVDAAGRIIPPKKKENTEMAESSSAASDLLKKYFRRTGG